MSDLLTEDKRNIKVLRTHARICNGAVEIKIKGPALKEHAKIFSGAADAIERLLHENKRLQRILSQHGCSHGCKPNAEHCMCEASVGQECCFGKDNHQ